MDGTEFDSDIEVIDRTFAIAPMKYYACMNSITFEAWHKFGYFYKFLTERCEKFNSWTINSLHIAEHRINIVSDIRTKMLKVKT